MPVAAEGETVAVSVMSVPAVVDELEAASVVVVDVVLEEVLLILPELQPIHSAARVRNPRTIAEQGPTHFIFRHLARAWVIPAVSSARTKK